MYTVKVVSFKIPIQLHTRTHTNTHTHTHTHTHACAREERKGEGRERREKTLVENFTIIHQHIISSLSYFSSKPLLTTTQSTEQHVCVLKNINEFVNTPSLKIMLS